MSKITNLSKTLNEFFNEKADEISITTGDPPAKQREASC